MSDHEPDRWPTTHILDVCNTLQKDTWPIWLRYGVNCRPYEDPPVVTLHPELVVLRGEYLRSLAKGCRARQLAEVGTARGFQSLLWGLDLVAAGDGGSVYTCDVVGMDEAVFKTPLTGETLLTRRELWADAVPSRAVSFVHGDSRELVKIVREPLDMVFIDGQHTDAWVTDDFAALRPHLRPGAIVVFDDCDDRFPGVQEAVRRIALQVEGEVQIVEFTPGPYKIAVLRPTCP